MKKHLSLSPRWWWLTSAYLTGCPWRWGTSSAACSRRTHWTGSSSGTAHLTTLNIINKTLVFSLISWAVGENIFRGLYFTFNPLTLTPLGIWLMGQIGGEGAFRCKIIPPEYFFPSFSRPSRPRILLYYLYSILVCSATPWPHCGEAPGRKSNLRRAS